MDPGEGALRRHEDLLRVRLRVRILVGVQLLGELLDVHEQRSRLLRLRPEQLAEVAVELVPDVARPPGRAAFRDETEKRRRIQGQKQIIVFFLGVA